MDNYPLIGDPVYGDAGQPQVHRRIRPANQSQALCDDPVAFMTVVASAGAAGAHDAPDPFQSVPAREHQTTDKVGTVKQHSTNKRRKKTENTKASHEDAEQEKPAATVSSNASANWCSPFNPGMLQPPPLFDEAEVRRALNLLLSPGQVTEVRALDATLGFDRYRTT